MELRKIRFYKSPILITYFISMMMSIIFCFINIIASSAKTSIVDIFLIINIYGLFIMYPIVLTACNLLLLFAKQKDKEIRQASDKIEILTFILGIVYTVLYLAIGLVEIKWADWQTQLYNAQLHTPIAMDEMLTFWILCGISIAAHILLKTASIEKIPPLIIALGISALYLGIGICSLLIVQIIDFELLILVLTIFPLNCILIFIKTVRRIVYQWDEQRETQEETTKEYKNSFLVKLNQYVRKSKHLPLISFLLLLPFLGIIIIILVLFGQRPDSIIRMWTETADWNLSQRIAPQNIMFDEHYLCTVAAGGHKKIVKPIRLGERHGHQVIVNRQLCIANAFEQILQERLPHFHSGVRYLYDNLGYPIARQIKSPYTADLIYYFMKPAEWIFLIAIYLCDAKPENRIAVQYLPKL